MFGNSCGNNSCFWAIAILVVLFFCCGNNNVLGAGCNNNCGCANNTCGWAGNSCGNNYCNNCGCPSNSGCC